MIHCMFSSTLTRGHIITDYFGSIFTISTSLSNNKDFDIADSFLHFNVFHAIEGTLKPKKKTIVVIYYCALRQLAWFPFCIKSPLSIGNPIIIQCFQYFRP